EYGVVQRGTGRIAGQSAQPPAARNRARGLGCTSEIIQFLSYAHGLSRARRLPPPAGDRVSTGCRGYPTSSQMSLSCTLWSVVLGFGRLGRSDTQRFGGVIAVERLQFR